MHPTLQVAKPVIVFCDFCTTLRIDLNDLMADDCKKDWLLELLAKHRGESGKEHGLYRHYRTNSKDVYDDSVQHTDFDTAENVLLPCLVR